MKPKLEYKIVESTYTGNVEAEVNKLIEEGWKPFGSLSVVPYGQSGSSISQAMIRETEE